ncbi:MAG: DinB family protein [Actinobacteria bacterium]|nr:DinB family protein [Actinomycetota bacterium]
MTPEPVVQPDPEDKDWTFVLDQGCADCDFDRSIATDRIGPSARRAAERIAAALNRAEAAVRPSPAVWSVLEYGCHVRDVCALMDHRLHLMLAENDPLFANWDQDTTAIEARYWAQNPLVVQRDLRANAEQIAVTLDLVEADQWGRPGRRSNGSRFTVESLARYFLHDLVHHAHDITA